MKSLNDWKLLAVVFIASSAMVAFNCQASEKAALSVSLTHERVVIQVSDDDPKKWNLAVNNAKNVLCAWGAANVGVEIVA